MRWIFSPLIDQNDITQAKALLSTDEWLSLLLLLQTENLSEKFSAASVIMKIESKFAKLRNCDKKLISIDQNKIDIILKRQYGYRHSISADIGSQYLSTLQNLS